MVPISQCIAAHDILTPSTFGSVIAAVEYGVLIVMSRWGPPHRGTLALRVWIVFVATSALALQIAWLVLRLTLESPFGNCLYLSLNVLYVLLNWTTDSFVIWRTVMVLGRGWFIVIPAICTQVCNIVLGCLFLAGLSGSSSHTWKVSRAFCVSYRTISLASTLSLTLALAVWLWRAKRQITSSAANGRGSIYIQVLQTLLLSAVIEFVPAVSYIVCVGLSDSAQLFFLPILGQAQALAPVFVLYYAAQRSNAVVSGNST